MACKKLGWKKISATLKVLSDAEMATIALIENMQREDLNYIEEALGYVRLIDSFDIKQEDLARRLGKSQSAIANKIRLLRLSDRVRGKLLDSKLTERHARALLKLSNEQDQLKLIDEVKSRELTVNQTEKRIEKMVEGDPGKGPGQKKKTIVRDMRIFLNTIRDALSIIQSSGLYPEVDETIEEDYIEIRIKLSKEMISE